MKTIHTNSLFKRLFFLTSLFLFSCFIATAQEGYVVCPNDGNPIIVDQEGNCSAFVDVVATTTLAICGPTFSSSVSSGAGLDASGVYPVGTTVVTFFSNCELGNSCTVEVIVNPPPIVCITQNDFAVNLDANGMYNLTFAEVDNGSFSECAEELFLSISPNQFTCADVGNVTVTLTVEDNLEQFTTCDVTVDVQDVNFVTCSTNDIDVYLDANGDASITVADIDNGTSGACPINLSLDETDFDCGDLGPQTVNLIVESTTNTELNTTCPAQVMILDTIPPTCSVMNITVSYDPNGTNFVRPIDIDNGSSDNCEVQALTLPGDAFFYGCAQIGDNTVVLTVTDNSGNTSSCEATVTVQGPSDALTCNTQDITVQLDAAGMVMITPQDVDNGSSSQCGNVNLAVAPDMFDCTQIGDNTVVLTVTDDFGNITTCEAVVTVEDDMDPTCGIDIETQYLNELGLSSISLSDLVASDDTTLVGQSGLLSGTYRSGGNFCDIDNDGDLDVFLIDAAGFGSSPGPGSTFINDGLGNFSNQLNYSLGNVHNVQLKDLNNDGFCDALFSKYDNTSEVYFNNGLGVFEPTVPQTLFNGFVNKSSAEDFDNDGDIDLFLGDIFSNGTLYLNNGIGVFTELAQNNALPVYSPFSFMNHHTSGDIDNDGDIDIFAQFSDNVHYVYENDGSGQFIFCELVGLNSNGKLNLIDLDGDLDLDFMIGLNSYFNQGNIGNIGNICNTDNSSQSFFESNSTSILQNVLYEFNDEYYYTALLNTGRQDMAQGDINGDALTDVFILSMYYSTLTTGGLLDNCEIENVAFSPNMFNCTNLGTPTDVIITVTDQSGNTSQCTSAVTVLDTIPPTCAAKDITINLQSGAYTLDPMEVDDGSTDNCVVELSVSPNTFDCMDIGTPVTITLTATDPSGNTSTCTSEVTVESDAAPTCISQDITVFLDANGEASYAAADIDNGSSVECGPVTLSATPTMFDCSQIGDHIVMLTVMDSNGNSSICPAIVTVVDEMSPECMIQDITVSLDESGLATITAQDIDDGSFDNCGPVSLSIDEDEFDCGNIGSDNMVTLTVEDVNENLAMCTANVTVQDTIAPQCPTNADLVVQLEAGQCDTAYVFDLPIAIDNCDPNPMSIAIPGQPMSGDTFAIGTHTIEYVVSDSNPNCSTGNSLIPNPTFEILAPGASNPDFNSQLGRADSWEQATQATSDYFNVNTYKDFMTGSFVSVNNPPPNDSDYWVGGVRLGERPNSAPEDYVEYIGTTLNTPLVASTPYALNMLLGTGVNDRYGDLIGDIVVLGIPAGTTFPITGFGCMDDNFSVIGSISVDIPQGTWQNVQVDILPDANYPRIMFGIGCNTVLENDEAYFLADDLILTEATNCISNTDTCSFNIEILEYIPQGLACEGEINFSLDPLTCSGQLTPEMVVNDQDVGCLDSCTVTLKTLDGQVRSDQFTFDDAGQQFQYEFCCGGICCWGIVNVEYKYVPEIECSDAIIEVSCNEAGNVAPPSVAFNCSNAEVIMVNEIIDMISCDSTYVGEIKRYWQVRDGEGNFHGVICEQIIKLTRFDLTDIDWPEHRMLAMNNELECPSEFGPDVTGVPMIESGGISFDSVTQNLSAVPISYYILDYDQDGDNDILVWDVFSGLYIAENDGFNNFNSTGVFYDVSQANFLVIFRDIRILDINNNGFPDIYIGNNGSNGTGEILLNDQNGSFVSNSQSFSDLFFDIVDVNGDSYPDLIIRTSNDDGALWLNDMNGNFTATGYTLSHLANQDYSLFDYDSDGDLDLLSYENPKYTLYEYEASSGFVMIRNLSGVNAFAPIVSDFNNDGLLDVFIASSTSSIWLNSNTGLISQNQSIGPIFRSPSVEDFNNDGYLDIFIMGSNSGEVWLNDGTGTFVKTTQSLTLSNNSNGSGTGTRFLGDIDNDGDIDICTGRVFNLGGGLDIWFNDGHGSFAKFGEFPFSNIDFFDFDLDGDLDIVRSQNNDNGIWENTGSGMFQLIKTFSDISFVEDINNDGKVDLIIDDSRILINKSIPSITQSLYPDPPTALCNVYTDYEDKELPSTDCVRKILRTWTVGEWHCTNPEPQTYNQIIEIVDSEGPVLTDLPADVTISTGTYICEATTKIDLPTLTDVCNEEGSRIDVSTGTPNGAFTDYQGQTVTLPVGANTINLTAYDGCGNITNNSYTITVVDQADPIAICDQFTTVAISLDSVAFVTAEAIDDGSFDECGPVTLLVARMDDPGFEDFSAFAPTAPIYCSDGGSNITVGLLVTDAGGNTNMCMVEVEVQDKVDAQLICPGEMEVECNFAFDPENLDAFFGEVTFLDNCPDANEIRQEIIGDLNSCGSGILIREIRLINAVGTQVDFCTQRITFRNGSPLQYSDIEPPMAEVTVEGCGVSAIDPSATGLPIIPDGVCQQVGINIENDTFPFSADGACLKILRTFRVVDWCIDDGPGSVTSPFEFVQTIKVVNTDGPEFLTVPEDRTICSFATDCGGITVDSLTATSRDACTDPLEVLRTHEIFDTKGTADISDDVSIFQGLSHDAKRYYDLGSYRIVYTAEDRCGNQASRTTLLTVESCKNPTPYCLSGLSVNINLMDIDGDGTIEGKFAMLTPDFFDAGSYHACSVPVQLSFSADLDDTLRTFGVDHVAELQEVQLWVTDEMGRSDYCRTFLDVQDNGQLIDGVTVTGRIYTENNDRIKEVEVGLEGAEYTMSMTNQEGLYAFPYMPTGSSYIINPSKDYDHRNGVSTLDLVMIQRHVLGLADLDSPYKIIAGDINRDDKLSASDLLALRKLILGVDNEFAHNTSWRFIDQTHIFEDPTDPWLTNFEEEIDIIDIQDHKWSDFIGVKIGDVNGNAVSGLLSDHISETRSSEQSVFEMDDRLVVKGETYVVEFTNQQSLDLYGLQVNLVLDQLEVVNITSSVLNIDGSNINIENAALKLSQGTAKGKMVKKGSTLFVAELKAKRDGKLSGMIQVNTEGLQSEVYLGAKLEISPLAIEWRNRIQIASDFIVHINTPNPWFDNTTIKVELPDNGAVNYKVKDSQGRTILENDRVMNIGNNEIVITKDQVTVPGIYFYEITFNNITKIGKMVKIN